MATNTANVTPSPRNNAVPVVQYIRRDITFADDGTLVTIGSIPAGSVILKPASGINVSTAFNGNATNTLDIGASDDSGTNNFATALALGTADFIPLDVTGSYYVSVDTKIVGSVISTASASAGVGQIVIAFVQDNDN